MHIKVHTALNTGTSVSINDTARVLVRQGFNPSDSAQVDRIKAIAAALISECEAIREKNANSARHASLAITSAEEAAMWAVKAATT
ncbi:DUF7681 family protein [Ruegeria sp.]|uniref:Acb2/Tad1 domain-containing protein n=1 Tax=Ruegeria sp. TaxID=1879320 RepID=UPI003B58B787